MTKSKTRQTPTTSSSDYDNRRPTNGTVTPKNQEQRSTPNSRNNTALCASSPEEEDSPIERRATRSQQQRASPETRRTRSTTVTPVSVYDPPSAPKQLPARRSKTLTPTTAQTKHTPKATQNRVGKEDKDDDEEDSNETSPVVEPMLANRPKRQIIPKSMVSNLAVCRLVLLQLWHGEHFEI